jgi:acyl-coenzyme A thioesterase PaaI-like protein
MRERSRGRVLHRDGDIAYMEATLFAPNGEVVASGSATARVIQLSG